MTDDKKLSLALTAPFPAEAIHWKPIATKGNRALAAAYLDARTVMQRLDQVLGVGGWKDAYEIVAGGSVVCTLSVKLDGEWVTKSDVGSPSEQDDAGDKLKAAFSDALKRAAVKLGIGRYLYRLPSQWVDWDPQGRRFTKTPSLPAWALPGRSQLLAVSSQLSANAAEGGQRTADSGQRTADSGQATNGSFLSTSPKTGDE